MARFHEFFKLTPFAGDSLGTRYNIGPWRKHHTCSFPAGFHRGETCPSATMATSKTLVAPYITTILGTLMTSSNTPQRDSSGGKAADCLLRLELERDVENVFPNHPSCCFCWSSIYVFSTTRWSLAVSRWNRQGWRSPRTKKLP